MKHLRLVRCPGSGRDNPHSFPVQDDERPRCSRCADVHHTVTVDGWELSFNIDDKLVDRKPVRTEPRRAYAAGAGNAPMALRRT